jgi:hypothetical protein
MPYIFIASVDTQPFDGANQAVNGARARMHYWCDRLIENRYEPFNELLLLGYMQQNSISVST